MRLFVAEAESHNASHYWTSSCKLQCTKTSIIFLIVLLLKINVYIILKLQKRKDITLSFGFVLFYCNYV